MTSEVKFELTPDGAVNLFLLGHWPDAPEHSRHALREVIMLFVNAAEKQERERVKRLVEAAGQVWNDHFNDGTASVRELQQAYLEYVGNDE